MNFLKYTFNCVCFFSAFGMSIYWCYKFWKDEDLCTVDYKHFDESEDDVYPMLSLCFSNVIIESKIKEYDKTFSAESHTNYLRGDAYYKKMENIDFDNVTLHFEDYILGENIWYKNGTEVSNPSPTFIPKITYSGFFNHLFLNKCFGLQMINKYIFQRFVGFNSSIFPDGNRPDIFFGSSIHLDGKFVLSENTRKDTWPTGKNMTTMRFNINQMEILRRRNKKHEPCMVDQLDYDEEMLKKHLEKLECRAPYQTHRKDLPICQTKRKMKEADYFFTPKMRPCTSLEGVIYRYEETNLVYKIIQSPFWIGMKFPTSFKEIKMVKAVDIQTVIGNAGGYVGLFLGIDSFFTSLNMIF